ncbi:MAG TPA: ATP-dependent sacrificial sulfur transferase LarE [Pirellulales bacterium]
MTADPSSPLSPADSARLGDSANADETRIAEQAAALVALLKPLERCVIAFSGGVDSAVVAQAAFLALGDRAVAVTADSESLPTEELAGAVRTAAAIGILHRVVRTREIDRAGYRANTGDRCYHCKSELYDQLAVVTAEIGDAAVLNGANLDDVGDYRPGMRAAKERGVRSPLIELSLNKADVRAIARFWGVSAWDKPASPCLASRIAYGQEVTPERLTQIEEGERFLHSLGLRTVRLRMHAEGIARIEAPLDVLPALAAPETRDRLVAELKRLGFRFVTLDLEGFRSGSLNQLLPILSTR